jgi:hypothetical protein
MLKTGRSNGDAGEKGDERGPGHEPCRELDAASLEMAALVKDLRSSPRRPSSIWQIKVGSKEVWR